MKHGFPRIVTNMFLLLHSALIVACSGDDIHGHNDTEENIARVLWLEQYDESHIPENILAKIYSYKNSDEAFGERFRHRLDTLLANPDSFTPDYTNLYTTLKQYSDRLTPHQAYAMNNLLGLNSSIGYQELPKTKNFLFPQDDRIQTEYQVGWHFFIGSVTAEDGEEYGVQVMFWRASLLPPTMAEEFGLTPIENQLAEIHFGISRAGDRHYRAKPYLISGTTGLIEHSTNPFRYHIGKNSLDSLSPDSLFPLKIQAWGLDETGHVNLPIQIDITLEQTKPYILQGEQGLSPSCGGIGTLYYSVPNLRINPSESTLRIGERSVPLSSGKLWYDHQWGTGFLPGGNPRPEVLRALNRVFPTEPGGWDWMALQLDDDTEITLSSLHTQENIDFYKQTGDKAPGTMEAHAYGFYIDQDGSYEKITATYRVTDWIKSTIHYDDYMETNTWYPNHAEVIIASEIVPESKRFIRLIPIVDNGQQGFFAHGPQYAEGAVYLLNENNEPIGRGFLESTDYAEEIYQTLKFAGMPQTEKMVSIVRPEISDELTQEASVFLSDPNNQAILLEEISQCKGL